MSGPFRELFVELPSALFDVLRGVGEEAVRAEQRRQYTPEARNVSRTSMLLAAFSQDGPGIRWLAQLLTLQSITLARAALDRSVEVRATLPCGHRVRGAVDERSLECARRGEMVDALAEGIKELLRRERKCACVLQEAS